MTPDQPRGSPTHRRPRRTRHSTAHRVGSARHHPHRHHTTTAQQRAGSRSRPPGGGWRGAHDLLSSSCTPRCAEGCTRTFRDGGSAAQTGVLPAYRCVPGPRGSGGDGVRGARRGGFLPGSAGFRCADPRAPEVPSGAKALTGSMQATVLGSGRETSGSSTRRSPHSHRPRQGRRQVRRSVVCCSSVMPRGRVWVEQRLRVGNVGRPGV